MTKAWSDEFTHPGAPPVDPKGFRAKATGIGQQAGASAMTGAMRAQRSIDACPPDKRGYIPVAEGFPKSTDEMLAEAGLLDGPGPLPVTRLALLKR